MVSLDWLTLSMDSPIPNPFDRAEPFSFISPRDRTDGFWTQPRQYGTPAFHRCVDILDTARRKVMTVSFMPRQASRSKGWCHVQFANETLYTGDWVKLFWMLRGFGFTYSSISQVDIAADGIEGEGGDFMSVVDARMKGEVKYYGKGDWSPYMERDNLNGFRIGTRISDKYVRCYNKTKELKRRGRKEWIENSWAQARDGECVSGDTQVQRFEASLKGKGIRRYVGHREGDEGWITSLANVQTRLSLFSSMAQSVFDFRIPAERARDAKPIVAWDFSKVFHGALTIDVRAPRNHILRQDEVRKGLRFLFLMALGMSRPELMEVAEATAKAESQDTMEWFQRKRFQWFKQYGKIIAGGDEASLRFFASLAEGRDNAPDSLVEPFGLE